MGISAKRAPASRCTPLTLENMNEEVTDDSRNAGLSLTAQANNITMPDYFHGEWCGEGGACPDGVMRVRPNGFTGGGAKCLLQRVRYKSPNVWLLNFKCTESGRKAERFEETWTL